RVVADTPPTDNLVQNGGIVSNHGAHVVLPPGVELVVGQSSPPRSNTVSQQPTHSPPPPLTIRPPRSTGPAIRPGEREIRVRMGVRQRLAQHRRHVRHVVPGLARILPLTLTHDRPPSDGWLVGRWGAAGLSEIQAAP